MSIKTKSFISSFLVLSVIASAYAGDVTTNKVDIAKQRANLEKNTDGKGFGPQSPRDIDVKKGTNDIYFSMAPKSSKMNLCNIHFHKGAEHRGGEFSAYIGDGDGHGYGSGFKYTGKLSETESSKFDSEVCPSKHGGLEVGDTIEVHYVYSTNQIKPGETLGSCLNDSTKNPQLRVEAQVYVLVNDEKAGNFKTLTEHKVVNGKHQAINIPTNTGKAISYTGSTTGPKYNEVASPYKVTWSVRPKVAKVNIKTIKEWCEKNDFNEDHAHAVRNLVINPKLLSAIE